MPETTVKTPNNSDRLKELDAEIVEGVQFLKMLPEDSAYRPGIAVALSNAGHEATEILSSYGQLINELQANTKQTRKHGTGGSEYGIRPIPASIADAISEVISQGRAVGKACVACGHQPMSGGGMIDAEKSEEAHKAAVQTLNKFPIKVIVLVGPNMELNPFGKGTRTRTTSEEGNKRGEIEFPVGTKLMGYFPKGTKVFAEVVQVGDETKIKVEKDGSLHNSLSHAAGVFTHTSGKRFWEPVKAEAKEPVTV